MNDELTPQRRKEKKRKVRVGKKIFETFYYIMMQILPIPWING